MIEKRSIQWGCVWGRRNIHLRVFGVAQVCPHSNERWNETGKCVADEEGEFKKYYNFLGYGFVECAGSHWNGYEVFRYENVWFGKWSTFKYSSLLRIVISCDMWLEKWSGILKRVGIERKKIVGIKRGCWWWWCRWERAGLSKCSSKGRKDDQYATAVLNCLSTALRTWL